MGTYRTAQICLNGHMINDSADVYPEHNEEYCSKCGQKTITTCPNCQVPIRGDYYVPGYYGGNETPVPAYCHHCGRPFPWTEKVLNNAVEILSYDAELDENTKQLIKDSIPGLLVDSVDTELSIVKFNSVISKVSDVIKNALYNTLVDVVSGAIMNRLSF